MPQVSQACNEASSHSSFVAELQRQLAYHHLTRYSTDRQFKMSTGDLIHDQAAPATNSYNNTHPSTSTGSPRLLDSQRYHLVDVMMKATKALSQLGPSREPRELTLFMRSIPFDGRIPDHHGPLWQAGFPSVFLDVILDRAWYASLPIDGSVGEPEFSALSEQSISALVNIPPYTVVR